MSFFYVHITQIFCAYTIRTADSLLGAPISNTHWILYHVQLLYNRDIITDCSRSLSCSSLGREWHQGNTTDQVLFVACKCVKTDLFQTLGIYLDTLMGLVTICTIVHNLYRKNWFLIRAVLDYWILDKYWIFLVDRRFQAQQCHTLHTHHHVSVKGGLHKKKKKIKKRWSGSCKVYCNTQRLRIIIWLKWRSSSCLIPTARLMACFFPPRILWSLEDMSYNSEWFQMETDWDLAIVVNGLLVMSDLQLFNMVNMPETFLGFTKLPWWALCCSAATQFERSSAWTRALLLWSEA